MKVTVLEPSGYCSGVEQAMNIALNTKKNNPHKNIVILGMLVHNQDSIKILEKHGIKTIYRENCSLEQLIDDIKSPSVVILTAHGHSKSVEDKLIKNGHEYVDATCPFVKNSFSEIKNSEKPIFYIGIKNHPESTAAISFSNKVIFIDANNPNIPLISNISPFVISQTTLSKFEINKIEEDIKKIYPNATFLNGICNASTKRQEALMNVSNDVELIYIVGGTNSNNTKTLYSLATKLYKDKIVKIIKNEEDINKKDLIGLSNVAISSGASTPKEVILKVKEKLMD